MPNFIHQTSAIVMDFRLVNSPSWQLIFVNLGEFCEQFSSRKSIFKLKLKFQKHSKWSAIPNHITLAEKYASDQETNRNKSISDSNNNRWQE
jgi:hypothetical protein